MQNLARIYALSRRNITLRYKNSIAGFFWGFFKPLLYLLIFIVIFSSQFTSVGNYVLYATSGLIIWFFFANLTSQSVAGIVGSSGLIKAINLPVVLFPVSEMIGELFNLFLTLLVYFVVMYWFGMVYSFSLLLIIPATMLFSVFALGITLMLSSLNVFFRDVGILWNTMMPALFYLTPIAYPENLIPERFKYVISYNPIYYFIRLCRTILFGAQNPPLSLWVNCVIISVVFFLVGWIIFRKLKNQFISAI